MKSRSELFDNIIKSKKLNNIFLVIFIFSFIVGISVLAFFLLSAGADISFPEKDKVKTEQKESFSNYDIYKVLRAKMEIEIPFTYYGDNYELEKWDFLSKSSSEQNFILNEMKNLLNNENIRKNSKEFRNEAEKYRREYEKIQGKRYGYIFLEEEYEKFISYIEATEKLNEKIIDFNLMGKNFNYQSMKFEVSYNYKIWVGKDFVSVEDMIKNSDEVLEKINFKNRTELCKFWQDEVPSETVGKNREKILKFKEKIFIYTPIVETSTLTNDELKNFLCKK
jgi:hypothetical protein